MRLSTRLLLVLLPAVTGVMTVYAIWAMRQRQETVVREARQETEAYANALVHAVEYTLRDPASGTVQGIINEIGLQPKIYGVLVYDTAGVPRFVSDPLSSETPAPAELLAQVLAGRSGVGSDRAIGDDRVYSAFRPLRGSAGRIIGALEVAQPLEFVERERARIGQRFALNTITLLVAVALATLFLVHRFVGEPMQRLVAGARALGRGERTQLSPGDTGGRELAMLAVELNRMVLQLQTAHASLRESEKMAAIGALAAGVAHEVAAPLNVISGRAELLLRRDALAPEQRRNLEIILEQIGRITRIVRNLLDFAKPRIPQLVAVDLAALLSEIGEFLETAVSDAGATLDLSVDPSLTIQGDPDLLHQVFSNLVQNAVQAVEAASGPRSIRVHGYRADATAVVDVEDTGSGVPADHVARIFEPFFTTKPRGTGLGLVVARGIVDAHGGGLTIDRSSPETGARFRVCLPMSP